MDNVRIVEVGPRDGLQNEARLLGVEDRIAMIRGLVAAGLKTIETGSFVSPKWVPQMAESEKVLRALSDVADVTFPVLVPNLKGYEAARLACAKEIAVFASASDQFSKKNINCTIDESFERFAPVIDAAKNDGIRVRGYVSCVLGCPYEGSISPSEVTRVAKRLLDMGCYEISLGDTIGVGTPKATAELVRAVSGNIPVEALALHCHNTYGQALANIFACLDEGVRVFDASVGGLGGCPYANGATGNGATEEVVYMLEGIGIQTGINLTALCQVALDTGKKLGKDPGSQVCKAFAARVI